jgi:hypothetical protein
VKTEASSPRHVYMGEIELSYVKIRYQAPIVYFTYKEGAELGFPEIKETIAYAEKLSGGKPYVTFSDVRVNMNITEEGKRYVSNLNNMPLFRGTAALVKNSMYSFAVNFMNNFNKKSYPFKAFKDKEKAIDWLKSLPLE